MKRSMEKLGSEMGEKTASLKHPLPVHALCSI